MIYLLILVGVLQLLQFLYCCKMLMYVRRRHRVIDARISNLAEWVIISHKSIIDKLTKMNELLQNTSVDKEDQLF